MKIIQFEWKKLWKSKAFIAILLITIALIAGLFTRNYFYQDIVKTQKMEMFREHSLNVISQVDADRDTLEEIGEGVDPILEENVELGLSLYRKLQELRAAVDAGEDLSALQLENEAYELAMQYLSKDKRYPLTEIEMQDEVKLNEELLQKELPKEDLQASIQPAVFMKQVMQLLFNTFGFFILVVIIGTPIVKEFDDHTIKLTYGLPISSHRLVLSKWLSMVLSGAIWFGLVLLAAYAVSTVLGKDLANPFEYPLYTEQMTFITMGEYVTQSIFFGLFYLILLMSFFIFLSFLLKSTLVVHIVLLILFVVNFIMTSNGVIHPIIPWSYQELGQAVILSETASWIGAVLSLVLTSILLLFAILTSKRREYR
ncbi:ABC transporter permease [Oceanobacillus manasiensis]|uniref:ABC transporter permease n=1 Tax=Oceanobacillus manasiensis TaxID=586413 RepID=UPI0005A87BC0|nr:ABC transporter permease subunit [Oceanobacillus manasiensis]